ncbi:MAG: hypothetical protein RMX65_001490 [Nostoc sp. DedQUE01]|nr:hypothetical protein [Nostoc sp. DedQUE11]MDZ8072333.1 hypothetical protein [Nostoc sp. DedQUE01]
MIIIKVVHSNSNHEVQKKLLALENYDVKSFVRKRLPIEKSLVESGNKDLLTRITEVMERTVSKLINDIRSQFEEENVEILSLEAARQKYPTTHNLSIGTYTLHPYDSKKLTRLEHYHSNLALEKDDELIVLLGRMGAKTLKITDNESFDKSRSGNLGVTNVAVVGTRVDADLSKKVEAGKDLLVTFEGNIVDIDPTLLKQSLWFTNDSRLNAIFESRRFSQNKIESYTLRNTYTETFDFDFVLASRYLAVDLDLKAEYRSLSKKERFFHVEFGR